MIEVRRLAKDYGAFRAVDDVSFSVRRGEVLGFLGPNGAGKSTTLKMLTGFLRPSAGAALIDGHDSAREPVKAKRLFGYLPERGPLYEEMTAEEYLKFCAAVRDLPRARRWAAVERALELCRLEEVRRQPLETLSKGFRQRVGLAQALLHDPPALILDEPTDGLDPNQKEDIRGVIASLGKEKAVLFSTHLLDEVEAICTRVVLIARGRLLADETPEALRRRHPEQGAVRVRLLHPVPGAGARLAADPAVRACHEETNTQFRLLPQEGSSLEERVFALAREQGWPVLSVERLGVRLESVFRELTRGEGAP